MKPLRRAKQFPYMAVATAFITLSLPTVVLAQSPRRPDSTAPATRTASDLYPELRTGREIVLFAVGGGLVIAGQLVSVSTRTVPAAGLDPSAISWGADRSVVGNRSVRADDASDWTRNAAMAFPLALALVTGQPGQRWHEFVGHGVVYAETMSLTLGSTLLAKSAQSRPRPFAYLPEAQRPDDPAYDVTQVRAFRSMPSGHSSSAWTGASLGITEHLLSRPDASWIERVGVGFVGGGLAATTSTLRVTAGQHFTSDVLAGAGIGVVTGVGMPLLHRGSRPLPPSKAWLESMGGALAGTLVGILVAR